IAHLDHDINTPLCVITLSMGRVKRYANELRNEGLNKSNNEITEAVNKISLLLQRLQSIKDNPLIGYRASPGQEDYTKVVAPAGNLDISKLQTTYTMSRQKQTTDHDKIDPALEDLLATQDKPQKGEDS
ncbi:MAG: hypothetical protein PHQ41_10100, partial [Candidatus Cloacimonetes bacterium]|nr:hypothetical protein [Candidatus Cloacimonadota bacterium]